MASVLFCVDVEVLGVEGDAGVLTVLMEVRVPCGVRGIGIEGAWMRRWGVLGGGAEDIGGVGYDLVPKLKATSAGRRPVPANPSQAE